MARELLVATITKRDRFYRVNNKIVPKYVAFSAVRQGVAQFSAAKPAR